MRFILLEDDEIAAAAVAWALDAYGHLTSVAHTGRQCFSILRDGDRPDALIIDITLRDGEADDGIAVARQVRGRWPALPIIFTTGHETYPGLSEILCDQKTRFLRKPYEISALIAIARELMAGRTERPARDDECRQQPT